MNPRPLTRAAIYVRISSDRSGEKLGVERQLRDCRVLAAAKGCAEVVIFEDNDKSAYSGKRRPRYEDMLESIKAGQIDVVIAWHTDRLHRRPVELEQYIDACQPRAIPTWTVQGGNLDLVTSSGRAAARIFGTMARQESERKSERLVSLHKELAERGQWASGERAYGYRVVRSLSPKLDHESGEFKSAQSWQVEIVEVEADIIRACAKRLLAGESLRSLVIDLQAGGVPTLKGGEWTTSTLRSILAAARNSGQREWTPRAPDQGSSDAARGPRRGYGFGRISASGSWPAILKEVETAQIRALLSDPARRSGGVTPNLLSGGLLICELCGQPMNSRTEGRRAGKEGPGKRTYACIRVPGRTKCGRMSIIAERADDVVSEFAIEALANIKTQESTPCDEEPENETALAARDRLKVISAMFGAGQMGQEEFVLANNEIQKILREASSRTPRPNRAPLTGLPRGEKLIRVWWSELPMSRRKAVLGVLFEQVICRASRKAPGYSKFQPERIYPEWRA